jgi:hypothetical protein
MHEPTYLEIENWEWTGGGGVGMCLSEWVSVPQMHCRVFVIMQILGSR